MSNPNPACGLPWDWHSGSLSQKLESLLALADSDKCARRAPSELTYPAPPVTKQGQGQEVIRRPIRQACTSSASDSSASAGGWVDRQADTAHFAAVVPSVSRSRTETFWIPG